MLRAAIVILLGVTGRAVADPAADIKQLVEHQLGVMMPHTGGDDGIHPADLFTDDGWRLAMDPDQPLVLFNSDEHLKQHGMLNTAKESDWAITIARDGKSAWVSLTSKMTFMESGSTVFDYRISEVVVKTPKGWKIAGGTWTLPALDADVIAAAKGGTITEHVALEGKADKGLLAAFTKLATTGVDAVAAARTDLVELGSAPKERTVGGSGFAKRWNAGWAKQLTIGPAIAKLAPSGTTGWVIANIQLARPGKPPYKIPFRAFFVFDKDDKGAWSLVHAHLSTKI